VIDAVPLLGTADLQVLEWATDYLSIGDVRHPAAICARARAGCAAASVVDHC
jgi:hypothetical protein